MSQKRARIGRSEECEKIEPHIFPAKFSHICYENFFVKKPITKYQLAISGRGRRRQREALSADRSVAGNDDVFVFVVVADGKGEESDS